MTGSMVLFGSGEIAPAAQAVYRRLFATVGRPIRLAILETPAGFELNSAWVAGRVGEFVEKRLPDFAPRVTIIPARKRDTQFSPDDPDIVAPLLSSNVIYMGAGSPTYAVRQLRDTVAWHMLNARHRLGVGIALASASVLAVGAYTIPVYEIYKVGEDIHWKAGLDLFGPYGLSLVFVPHWNNTDGGADLDTSRCFMGQHRFAQLREMLPDTATIVGIDEHTALLADLNAQSCQVLGRGGVTLTHGANERRFESDRSFSIAELGPFQVPSPSTGIPATVWEQVQAASAEEEASGTSVPPPQVLDLVEKRQLARMHRNWHAADSIRDQLSEMGWQIRDTPDGPELLPTDHGQPVK